MSLKIVKKAKEKQKEALAAHVEMTLYGFIYDNRALNVKRTNRKR